MTVVQCAMRTPCVGRRENRIAASANLAGRATAKHAQVSKINGDGQGVKKLHE